MYLHIVASSIMYNAIIVLSLMLHASYIIHYPQSFIQWSLGEGMQFSCFLALFQISAALSTPLKG